MFFDQIIEEIFNKEIDTTKDIFKNHNFIKFYLNKQKLTYDSIVECSEGFKFRIRKPQRCIVNKEDYYIGIDLITNMYYMAFRNVMMIDIDFNEKFKNVKDVQKFLNDKKDAYILYKTRNGVHIFVLNKTFDYKSKETIDYMIEFGCDYKYIICTFLRGFTVRLNQKFDGDFPVYKFLCIINKELIDPYIYNLVKTHIEFTKIFQHEIMYDRS